MNLAYAFYIALTSGLFLSAFPFCRLYAGISAHSKESLNQRMGCYPRYLADKLKGKPRIWIHAVSVGEAGVARAIIEAIKSCLPDCEIILSVTTPKGYEFAQKTLGSRALCIFAPIDFILSVKKALSFFKPDALVFLETEIWPNWLTYAHKKNIPIAIVNGRISEKSLRGYLKISSLFKYAMAQIDAFSMISRVNAERIIKLGADPKKIAVNGNAKFDLPLICFDPKIKENICKKLNLAKDDRVIVAGSTRSGEEAMLLDSYEKLKDFSPIFIIAPRHVERTPQIISLIKSRGLSFELYSRLKSKNKVRTAPLVLVDTIGDLAEIYSAASLVFCGASLVPLGGHNILEPAAWGKPVFYGPFMDDFNEAKMLLENSNASIPVKNKAELVEKMRYLLGHPSEGEQIGERAKKIVMAHQGAAKKHADLVLKLLNYF